MKTISNKKRNRLQLRVSLTRESREGNTRFVRFDVQCEIDGAIGASQWGTIDGVLRTWCDQASRLRPCAIGRDADKPPSSLCTSDSRAFICRRTKMPVPNKQRYRRSVCFDHREATSDMLINRTIVLSKPIESGSKRFHRGDFQSWNY